MRAGDIGEARASVARVVALAGGGHEHLVHLVDRQLDRSVLGEAVSESRGVD